MRRAEVYRNDVLAGYLTETDKRTYVFEYKQEYFNDVSKPAISLILPKTQMRFTSEHLFPFFYNMLSEGANREVQSRQLKIDKNDYFGLLLATAQHDTVGAITVKKIDE